MTAYRAVGVGAGLTLVLLVAAGSPARDVCLQPDEGWGCFPCDLPIAMDWIGFSTDGPPCASAGTSRPPATGDASAGEWWNGMLTLSASDEDPFANEGLLGVDRQLHLWLADAGCGYGFSEGYVVVQGDLPLESYTPIATGTQTWTPSGPFGGTLDLGLHCVGDINEPVLLGTFQLPRRRSVARDRAATGVEPSTWGSVKNRWQPVDRNVRP